MRAAAATFVAVAISLASVWAGFLPLPGTDPVTFRTLGESLVLQAPSKVTRWLLIRPVLHAVDNVTDRPPGTVLPLTYRVELLDASYEAPLDAGRIADGTGAGTLYFAAWGGRHPPPLEIYEREALQIHYAGRVFQVVTRGGNTYPDYLRELEGTPFIMGPGVVGNRHQTDQRQGSDCAALAIYGMRRMGFDLRYGGPKGILEYLDSVHPEAVRPDREGVYRDTTGQTIATRELQAGDILHFGQQVSVFAKDQGVRGFLDVNDIVFESWGNSPREIAIGKSDFTRLPLRIYRWKKILPRK